MNKCPHCQATASPLRLFWRLPYVCPRCKGHSQHSTEWLEFQYILAALISAGTIGVLYERVALLRNSTFLLVVWLILELVVCLVLIRWVFGRLTPLPKDDQHLPG
jgi:hypothetical protein